MADACIEVHGECNDTEIERILARVDEADVVVMTNYFDRRGTYEQRSVNRVIETGKPVIVVTNSPFRVQDSMKTVICTYGVVTVCLDALV